MSKQTVFVSGATGFIAQHIIKHLLSTEKYKVIGSVRAGPKAEKLKADFNNNKDLSFVFVDDISKLEAFDEAFKEHGSELDYVLHTASPISTDDTDYEKGIIVPAVNGTRGIIEATVKYAPNVKTFVLTSSFVALCTSEQTNDPNFIITEKSWNNLSLEEALRMPGQAYRYAKTTAEKIAWELHETLHAKFSLTVINPAWVFGPQCFDSSVTGKLNVSCEFINSQIHSKYGDPINERMKGSYIDVRDVARAQVECLSNKELAGKRLILSNGRFTFHSIADVLNEKFPELRGKIAVGEPGADKKLLAGASATVDNHMTKELLGFKFRSFEESVVDTAVQILKVESTKRA